MQHLTKSRYYNNKYNWQKIFKQKELTLHKPMAHLGEAERDWKF